MPDQEEIEQQEKLLAIYRRTLADYLRQQAIHGDALVPPAILHGIREARANIEHIKSTLQSWDVVVEDLPDDKPTVEIEVISPSKQRTSTVDNSTTTVLSQLQGNHLLRSLALLSMLVLLAIMGVILWTIQSHSITTAPTVELLPTRTESDVSIVSGESSQKMQPISTPLIKLPLQIGLHGQNCTESMDRVREDIQHMGAILATQGSEQMNIDMHCIGQQVALDIRFPEAPAYRMEFLDELPSLSLTTEIAYGRTVIQAAIAYAIGNYEQAASLLDQAVGLRATAAPQLLHAQVLMHLGRWPEAQKAYSIALEGWPDTETVQRARSYAGRGLAYIRNSELTPNDTAVLKQCAQNASVQFDQAIANQADRALWLVGRALAELVCPTKSDPKDIRKDLEKGLQLLEHDRSVDRALALSMMARVSFFFDDDTPRAIDLAEQAISITQEIPSPYRVLSCIYEAQSNEGMANSYYEQYKARLVHFWGRADITPGLEEDGTRAKLCNHP